MSGRVVVIGGGVIGAASAYFLAKGGWTVTVLEQGEFGRGCSHGNCGFVSPSHVLPLAGPGAMSGALKALFTPNSPLSIKPRLDTALWSWLYRFARRCNRADMLSAGLAIKALLDSSRNLFGELIAAEAMDCEWEHKGVLFVFYTKRGLEHHGETEKILSDSFGVRGERLDADALQAREPALKPGLPGAWYHHSDAHLRPDRLMTALRRVLERQGVVIREHCQVTGLARSNGSAKAVKIGAEEIAADSFLVCTGAWTAKLQNELGCRIPIQPGKGYSITMPRPATCPKYPLLFEEHRVGVTPFASGYRLGSTMEFAGFDATLNPRRLDLLREGAKPYLHEPFCEPVQESWFGWRPMTPDSVPIIDFSPSLKNVLIAAGHNMLGVSMAPGTGKLAMEMLSGVTPHVDPKPYAVGRF